MTKSQSSNTSSSSSSTLSFFASAIDENSSLSVEDECLQLSSHLAAATDCLENSSLVVVSRWSDGSSTASWIANMVFASCFSPSTTTTTTQANVCKPVHCICIKTDACAKMHISHEKIGQQTQKPMDQQQKHQTSSDSSMNMHSTGAHRKVCSIQFSSMIRLFVRLTVGDGHGRRSGPDRSNWVWKSQQWNSQTHYDSCTNTGHEEELLQPNPWENAFRTKSFNRVAADATGTKPWVSNNVRSHKHCQQSLSRADMRKSDPPLESQPSNTSKRRLTPGYKWAASKAHFFLAGLEQSSKRKAHCWQINLVPTDGYTTDVAEETKGQNLL